MFAECLPKGIDTDRITWPNRLNVCRKVLRSKDLISTSVGCLADGTKLPPVIIFKLVNVSREEFPDGVIIRANAKGWMNENEPEDSDNEDEKSDNNDDNEKEH